MTTTTRAIRSTSLLAVIALVTTLAAAPPAQAAPVSPTSNAVVTAPRELPGGWARSSDGRTLTWTSPTLIPIGGSRLDVVAGERLLGTGVLSRNQRSVSVPLSPDAATDPSVAWADLAVVASGRRLSDPSVAAVPSGRLPGDMPLEGTLPRLARQLVSPDPGLPGPYATVTGKYALPRVAIAGLPAKVEVKGVVVAPQRHDGRAPPGPPAPRSALDLLPRRRGVHRGLALSRRFHRRSPATAGTSRPSSSWRRRATSRCPSPPTGSTVRTGCSRTAAQRHAPSWCATTSRCGSAGRGRPPPTPSPRRPCGLRREPISTASSSSGTRAVVKASTARPSTARPDRASRGRSAVSCTSGRPRSVRTRHPGCPSRSCSPTATETSPTSRARPTSTPAGTRARTPCSAAPSWSSARTTTSSTRSGRPERPSPPRGTTGATTPTACAARVQGPRG